MLISNKKEGTSDMLDNSDESPNHNVQGKQTTQTGTYSRGSFTGTLEEANLTSSHRKDISDVRA